MAQWDKEETDHLRKDETHDLISASKVDGTKVYDRDHDSLGEVADIMIDKISGKVAYAVIEFGGFLGMGGQRRALPWSVLTYDEDEGGYVVNVDKDLLKGTPEYEEEDLSNRDWAMRIHQHFSVAPYWS
ncbi:MAG TPA: PRC-barrel domain-containing protein [Dongiaceae bacterium]|jgi:sporulation protein YlmC with PRC-barrel domain|nr:PRC-barrel domain-containing protein [Dongiaceae bacterium]